MSANSTMFPKEISKTSTKAEMPRKDMPGSTSAAEMPRGSMVERHGQDTMAPGRMDPPTGRRRVLPGRCRCGILGAQPTGLFRHRRRRGAVPQVVGRLVLERLGNTKAGIASRRRPLSRGGQIGSIRSSSVPTTPCTTSGGANKRRRLDHGWRGLGRQPCVSYDLKSERRQVDKIVTAKSKTHGRARVLSSLRAASAALFVGPAFCGEGHDRRRNFIRRRPI